MSSTWPLSAKSVTLSVHDSKISGATPATICAMSFSSRPSGAGSMVTLTFEWFGMKFFVTESLNSLIALSSLRFCQRISVAPEPVVSDARVGAGVGAPAGLAAVVGAAAGLAAAAGAVVEAAAGLAAAAGAVVEAAAGLAA